MVCLKRKLASDFEVNDSEKLRHFLGMGATRSKQDISVSQRKYFLDLLKETRMLGCKLVDTHMEPMT